MWAMIPMFRTRSSATRCSVVAKSLQSLPAVVRESLVGLRHPIHVVLALVRVPLLLERVEDLAGELVAHVLLATVAGERDDPAQRERAPTALGNLDRHLVVRATDAARLDLEHRGDRLHGLFQHLDRRPARLFADLVQGGVDDRLGGRLLAVPHHAVHQLGDQGRVVDRVRDDRARGDFCAARHYEALFFAPYFERPCLRSATPEASSAARITLYRKPGRSLTRPPRISTTECSCRLWPSPGM